MAVKRSRPLDDPPPATSSVEEEEEEEVESEEEEEVEEDEEGEEEEEEEEQPQQTQTQTQTKPKPKPAESEEEDDEEDDLDEDDEGEDDSDGEKPKKSEPEPEPEPELSSGSEESDSHKASDFSIKPISPPKPKKAKLDQPNPKKPKPNVDGTTGEKKSAVHRLWSEEDEIAILKGLIEFESKFGKDPSNKQGEEFHEYMKKKKSLSVADVSKSQLMDKVRRLRRKYKMNVEKSGEDPVFSKPNDIRCFQLSKKIWGEGSKSGKKSTSNGTASVGVHENSSNRSAKNSSDKKTPAHVPADNAATTTTKTTTDVKKVEDVGKGKKEKVEPEVNKEGRFEKLYPCLWSAVQSGYMSNKLPHGFGVTGGTMTGLKRLESPELKELESQWRELDIAETEVLLRRMDLIREQTSRVYEAMKSS